MWGTTHTPLSQQRFSFFVTAPYNVMRFSVTAFSLLLALTIVFVGCDTTGVTPIESEIPDGGSAPTQYIPAHNVTLEIGSGGALLDWDHAFLDEVDKFVVYRANSCDWPDPRASITLVRLGETQSTEFTDEEIGSVGCSSGDVYSYGIDAHYANSDTTRWVTKSFVVE
jgi:hypothetical protein